MSLCRLFCLFIQMEGQQVWYAIQVMVSLIQSQFSKDSRSMLESVSLRLQDVRSLTTSRGFSSHHMVLTETPIISER
jgi:hypothetical protein